MVEQSTHDHMFEGLNPAEAIIGFERERNGKSHVAKSYVWQVASNKQKG
jgi:hypothetical protein